MRFEKVSFIIAFIIGCVQVTALKNCRDKTFVLLNNKEYEIFFKKETHKNAQLNCVEWGKLWKSERASLAQVFDEETQECLTQMARTALKSNNFENLFLGGVKKEGDWWWEEGRRIATFPSQTSDNNRNNTPNKECLTMKKSGGQWEEANCDERHYYVCERVITDERLWGYYRNKHSLMPREWSKKFHQCRGKRQSPVNIPVSINQLIKEGGRTNLSTVSDWVLADNLTGDVTWKIANTGRMIKLTPVVDCSVYTTFKHTQEKYCVDRVELKWGEDGRSGSDHTIGNFQFAGELQIFHRPQPGSNEVHALAFLLQQRAFFPNENWGNLLRHIALVQETNTTATMTAPPGMLKQLLGDVTHSRKRATPEFISYVGIRYAGSLTTPPCDENVIWTVYPRAISLSHSQFVRLRLSYMEGRIGNNPRYLRETTRHIQQRSADFYLVGWKS